jgi:type II secretory pathway pseudopilin PulG
MVTMDRPARRRDRAVSAFDPVAGGFGLVEVIVALSLLAIAIMSVAAGAAFSSVVLQNAETIEQAARIAELVIDSVSAASAPASGTRTQGMFTTRWGTDAGAIQVTVSSIAAPTRDLVHVVATATPVLDTVPCDACR